MHRWRTHEQRPPRRYPRRPHRGCGYSRPPRGKIDIFDFHAYRAIDGAIADKAVNRLAEGKNKGGNFKIRRVRYSSGRPLSAFIWPCRLLLSSRLFCEPRVGLVALRALRVTATLMISATKRSNASARFIS